MLYYDVESTPKEELDRFVEAMITIAGEVEEDPGVLHGAPHFTPVGRLDETRAARKPVLRWKREGNDRRGKQDA